MGVLPLYLVGLAPPSVGTGPSFVPYLVAGMMAAPSRALYTQTSPGGAASSLYERADNQDPGLQR